VRREGITAIVLCGGSGARLGAVDKTLVPVGGRPLVTHTLEALAPQVGQFVLSCGRDPAPYEAFGHPVATDAEPGAGPLGGIISALPLVETEWILTHPGDAPSPDPHLVDRLAGTAETGGAAVPRTGDYRQNLVLLVSRSKIETLARFYRDGGRAVWHWLDDEDIESVDMDDVVESFFNVNTPGDLAIAEHRLAVSEQRPSHTTDG
jgi:molybdopterin-guanine dinucleotide biosynthesis protein A